MKRILHFISNFLWNILPIVPNTPQDVIALLFPVLIGVTLLLLVFLHGAK